MFNSALNTYDASSDYPIKTHQMNRLQTGLPHSSLIRSLLIASILPAVCLAAPLQLQNKWVSASLDPTTGAYSVHSAQGTEVLGSGSLYGSEKNAEIVDVKDPAFGQGKKIVSGKASITLFDSLPFVLIQSSLDPAPPPQSGVFPPKTITLTTAEVRLSPLSSLKIMGTGGLMQPKEGVNGGPIATQTNKPVIEDKAENTDQSFRDQPQTKPGSYGWAVVGEPKSRKGLVMAWLTQDKAAGLVFASLAKGSLSMEARAEYGRYANKTAVPTEIFAIGYFDDVRLGLEAWADAVAKLYGISLPKQMSGYSSNSVGNGHGIAGLENETAEVAKFAARELKRFGLQYLQMDDGWQVAKRDFTTHDPKGPYPGGMKLTANRISEAGLIPGLWTVPFVGNGKDPSILAKTPDGTPYKARWSGLCLDLTVPKAVDYMKNITHMITHDWGYRFLKLDGFHSGAATENVYVNTGYRDTTIGAVQLADPTKTQIEAFRSGIKALREAAGPDVFLLGCAITQNMISYNGSFGLVDAMRVGPDNAGDWGHWAPKSPIFGTRHYFENRRIWYVDPDMAYTRPNKFSIDQARTSCSWTSISGQLFTASDWLQELPPERLDLLKRTMEPHHGIARPVDFFEHPTASIWLLSDKEPNPDRQIVAFYNIVPYKKTISDTFERIGLDPAKEYIGFDFWENKLAGPFKQRMEESLNSGQCRIYAVLPMPDHPRLLSTSRHITQGMVDCLEETWDAAKREVRCRNRLIAGDPCEMRVYMPEKNGPWNPGKPILSQEDVAAGVTLGAASREGNLLRFTVTAPRGRDVSWSVGF